MKLRSRRRFRVTAAAVMGALLAIPGLFLIGVVSVARAGFDYEDIFILSRLEEANSLRDLLSDPVQRARIENLLPCLPAWQVVTEEIAPGTAYRHTFCFAPPAREDLPDGTRRLTSRSFHLIFETRWDVDTGKYEAVAVRGRHDTAPREVTRPAIREPVCLDLLRLALKDELFFSELRSWMQNFPQASIKDFTADQLKDNFGNPLRRFRIGFHRGGLAGEQETQSRFWIVSYDAESGEGSFSLEE